MKEGTKVTIIPAMRRVYKDTKANLDALTGLKDEDLGYGTDTLKLYRQNGAGAANWEIIAETKVAGVAVEATVPLFQANPATGDFTSTPQNINNDDTATDGSATIINQYAEVDFGMVVCIRRWRHFGKVQNAGDGEWKIQYYNLETHAWVDWATGIATRATADWSGFTTETEVLTDKIRLITVALDTLPAPDRSYMPELEVIY